MAYEMRAGSGSLFRNDKKEKDKQPDMKGKVMLPDGTVHWLSGWTKTGTTGKWLSLQIGEPVNGGGQSMPPLDAHNAAKGNGYQPDDDDLPF